MHHAFLCISLPALHDHDVKMPIRVLWSTLTSNDQILFLFLHLDMVPGIQLREGSPTFDTTIKLGGFCNDDSDGKENNVKKEKGLKGY